MSSTFTSRLRLDKMGHGDDTDSWDTTLNLNFDLIDSSISGREAIATTGGTTTLTSNNGAADQARMAILDVSGVLVSNATITCPDSVSKWYIVKNGTTGSYTLTVKTVSGTGVTVTQGKTELVFCDGTNVERAFGSRAYLDQNQSFTKAQGVDRSALTDAATVAVDASLSNVFTLTIGGNRTLGQPTNPKDGQGITIFITQDGTGSRTLAYHADWLFPGGTEPTLSTAAAAVDVFSAVYNGATTKWYAVLNKTFG